MKFPSIKKVVSVGLSMHFFVFQTVLGSATETNIWTERRKALFSPNQYASLPASIPPIRSAITALPAAFSINTFAGSPLGKLVPPLQALVKTIPQNGGTVQDIYDSGDGKTSPVVVIQDVHMNPEAQSNIVLVLQALINGKQVGTVGVEGAFTRFNFRPFRAFDDKAKVAAVAQAFIDKNLLAAPSYVGITSSVEPPLFIGIDDRAHYDANVAAYLRTRASKESVKSAVGKEKRALLEQKRKIYSPELLRLDQAKEAYHAGTLGLGKYLETLSQNLAPSFELEQFLEAYRMESQLDFTRVEAERKTILEKLTAKLTADETSVLIGQSLAYRLGQLSFGAYYAGLRDICERKGVSLAQAPMFARYIQYVLLVDGIKADRLFDELQKLESDTLARLTIAPEQKELAGRSEFVLLAEKLIEFSLTPREWERYRSTKDEMRSTNLRPFEDFYRQADIRSHKMVENFLNIRTSNFVPRTLVVGGFHTPLITQLLKERKISYVVVAPKITKIDDAGGSSYLSVFAQEKMPLDKLFKGQALFLAPPVTLSKVLTLYGALVHAIGKATSFVWTLSGELRKFHIKVLRDADLTAVEVTPDLTWKEKLYLAFGVNWEVTFPLVVRPLLVWGLAMLMPGLAYVDLIAGIGSSLLFALSHPQRTARRLTLLTLLGMALELPFLLPGIERLYAVVLNVSFHSVWNAFVWRMRTSSQPWLKKIGSWLPLGSTQASESEPGPKINADVIPEKIFGVYSSSDPGAYYLFNESELRFLRAIGTLFKAGSSLVDIDPAQLPQLDVKSLSLSLENLKEDASALVALNEEYIADTDNEESDVRASHYGAVVEKTGAGFENMDAEFTYVSALLKNCNAFLSFAEKNPNWTIGELLVEVNERTVSSEKISGSNSSSLFSLSHKRMEAKDPFDQRMFEYGRFSVQIEQLDKFAHVSRENMERISELMGFAMTILLNADPRVKRYLLLQARSKPVLVGDIYRAQEIASYEMVLGQQRTLAPEALDYFLKHPSVLADLVTNDLMLDVVARIASKADVEMKLVRKLDERENQLLDFLRRYFDESYLSLHGDKAAQEKARERLARNYREQAILEAGPIKRFERYDPEKEEGQWVAIEKVPAGRIDLQSSPLQVEPALNEMTAEEFYRTFANVSDSKIHIYGKYLQNKNVIWLFAVRDGRREMYAMSETYSAITGFPLFRQIHGCKGELNNDAFKAQWIIKDLVEMVPYLPLDVSLELNGLIATGKITKYEGSQPLEMWLWLMVDSGLLFDQNGRQVIRDPSGQKRFEAVNVEFDRTLPRYKNPKEKLLAQKASPLESSGPSSSQSSIFYLTVFLALSTLVKKLGKELTWRRVLPLMIIGLATVAFGEYNGMKALLTSEIGAENIFWIILAALALHVVLRLGIWFVNSVSPRGPPLKVFAASVSDIVVVLSYLYFFSVLPDWGFVAGLIHLAVDAGWMAFDLRQLLRLPPDVANEPGPAANAPAPFVVTPPLSGKEMWKRINEKSVDPGISTQFFSTMMSFRLLLSALAMRDDGSEDTARIESFLEDLYRHPILDVGAGKDLNFVRFLVNELKFNQSRVLAVDPRIDPAKLSESEKPYYRGSRMEQTPMFRHRAALAFSFFVFNDEIVSEGSINNPEGINVPAAADWLQKNIRKSMRRDDGLLIISAPNISPLTLQAMRAVFRDQPNAVVKSEKGRQFLANNHIYIFRNRPGEAEPVTAPVSPSSKASLSYFPDDKNYTFGYGPWLESGGVALLSVMLLTVGFVFSWWFVPLIVTAIAAGGWFVSYRYNPVITDRDQLSRRVRALHSSRAKLRPKNKAAYENVVAFLDRVKNAEFDRRSDYELLLRILLHAYGAPGPIVWHGWPQNQTEQEALEQSERDVENILASMFSWEMPQIARDFRKLAEANFDPYVKRLINELLEAADLKPIPYKARVVASPVWTVNKNKAVPEIPSKSALEKLGEVSGAVDSSKLEPGDIIQFSLRKTSREYKYTILKLDWGHVRVWLEGPFYQAPHALDGWLADIGILERDQPARLPVFNPQKAVYEGDWWDVTVGPIRVWPMKARSPAADATLKQIDKNFAVDETQQQIMRLLSMGQFQAARRLMGTYRARLLESTAHNPTDADTMEKFLNDVEAAFHDVKPTLREIAGWDWAKDAGVHTNLYRRIRRVTSDEKIRTQLDRIILSESMAAQMTVGANDLHVRSFEDKALMLVLPSLVLMLSLITWSLVTGGILNHVEPISLGSFVGTTLLGIFATGFIGSLVWLFSHRWVDLVRPRAAFLTVERNWTAMALGTLGLHLLAMIGVASLSSWWRSFDSSAIILITALIYAFVHGLAHTLWNKFVKEPWRLSYAPPRTSLSDDDEAALNWMADLVIGQSNKDAPQMIRLLSQGGRANIDRMFSAAPAGTDDPMAGLRGLVAGSNDFPAQLIARVRARGFQGDIQFDAPVTAAILVQAGFDRGFVTKQTPVAVVSEDFHRELVEGRSEEEARSIATLMLLRAGTLSDQTGLVLVPQERITYYRGLVDALRVAGVELRLRVEAAPALLINNGLVDLEQLGTAYGGDLSQVFLLRPSGVGIKTPSDKKLRDLALRWEKNPNWLNDLVPVEASRNIGILLRAFTLAGQAA